jgi:hypothetical protein
VPLEAGAWQPDRPCRQAACSAASVAWTLAPNRDGARAERTGNRHVWPMHANLLIAGENALPTRGGRDAIPALTILMPRHDHAVKKRLI